MHSRRSCCVTTRAVSGSTRCAFILRHLLMQGVCASRLHNLSWQPDVQGSAMVARAARFILHAQVEAGSLCPVTMTHAAIPLLQTHLPAPYADWHDRLLSDRYDAHHLPGSQKRGLLIGMGMTEKQGGTDVLSNTTRAEPRHACAGQTRRITGHKWFSRCRKATRT